MQFEFATAGQILFGPGRLKEAGAHAARMGRKTLVATGLQERRSAALWETLEAAGVADIQFPVVGEPTVDAVRQGVELARLQGCDLVIGFGGGSAIDTAKAIAALLANPGDPLDYLEVVGAGQTLSHPSFPCIAIPTTAGTGAEVTRNAVLGVPERSVKVSMRSPWMLPRLALVDPELTYSLSPQVTAASGLDALTQLIEPYLSNAANPITDGLCREGMRRAARSLRRAYEDGADAKAREDMSIASLLGGLALANARLGAVHGFAGVLGGMFPAPHGAICARLLPPVMAANLEALHQRQPASPVLARFDEVAALITGDQEASAQQGVAWLAELVDALHIPPLSSYGVEPGHFPEIIDKSARASSMKGNPVPLTSQELGSILEQAL